jgi:hypothetical protein
LSIIALPLYPKENVVGKVNVINVGQCLPATCSGEDVKSIMGLDPAVRSLQFSQNLTETRNELKVLSTKLVPGTYDLLNDHRFHMAFKITVILFILVIVATIYEVYLELNKLDSNAKPRVQGPVAQFILCFALWSNAKSILSLNRSNTNSFTCIHGLRTFSLIWTVFGHTSLMMNTIGANRVRGSGD